MGFDCGINIAKKYKDDMTLEEYGVIDLYMQWLNNPWNKESGHYPTFKDYWTIFLNYDESSFPGEPNEDVVEFYTNNKEESLECWCSTGRYLDRFFDWFKSTGQDEIEINKDILDKAEEWVISELDNYSLEIVHPSSGIVVQDDSLSLKQVDGVEFENNNGSYTRVYNEDDSLLYCNDIDIYYTLLDFKQCIKTIKVLYKFHLNSNLIIYYWRSY